MGKFVTCRVHPACQLEIADDDSRHHHAGDWQPNSGAKPPEHYERVEARQAVLDKFEARLLEEFDNYRQTLASLTVWHHQQLGGDRGTGDPDPLVRFLRRVTRRLKRLIHLRTK